MNKQFHFYLYNAFPLSLVASFSTINYFTASVSIAFESYYKLEFLFIREQIVSFTCLRENTHSGLSIDRLFVEVFLKFMQISLFLIL